MSYIVGHAKHRAVFIGGESLGPQASQAIINHSPDGYNWGYSGSGPAQLALAIMLYILKPDMALQLYHDFKRDFIAPLEQNEDFSIPIKDVIKWIMHHPKFCAALYDKIFVQPAAKCVTDALKDFKCPTQYIDW